MTVNICLNMIVKNESAIIVRMLESVVSSISTYCICDTGSSDNTMALIKSFFDSRNIAGIIVEKEFVDFEYNRSFALNACRDIDAYLEKEKGIATKTDYILCLDADMEFYCGVSMDVLLGKKKDVYMIHQGNSFFDYSNARLVSTAILDSCSHWGVTHEYLCYPSTCSVGGIDKTHAFIHDIGDGGCKADKSERDIRLLTAGLVRHPNNTRYTFYKTYFEIGNYQEAIKHFNTNVKLDGWVEERWCSYYCLGKCHLAINHPGEAIQAWLDAYSVFPYRIEYVYEIVKCYRCCGQYLIDFTINLSLSPDM
jgi:tetratricopeptide (TPR) repeat protein